MLPLHYGQSKIPFIVPGKMLANITSDVLKQIILACLNCVFAFEYWLTKRQYKRTFIDKKPVEYEGIVTDEEFHKSRLYSQDHLSFAIIQMVFSTIISFLTLRFNLQKYLWDKSIDTLVYFNLKSTGEIYPSIAYMCFQIIMNTLISLPLSIYSIFWIEEKHGFNKITWKTFISDNVKNFIIGLLIGPPLSILVIWVMNNTTNLTFLYLWIIMAILNLLFLHLFPVLIQPLFNKLVPLEEGELKERINQLASRHRFPLNKIYVIDGSKRSSHSNAYFYGFFGCKHIVIFDTLIKQCTTDEIIAILGHELGHWKYNHVMRRFLVGQAYYFFLFVGFSWLVRNPILYEAFGFKCSDSSDGYVCKPIMIGGTLFSVLLGPIQTFIGSLMNYQSRVHEYEADQFACENDLGEDLKAGLIKLLVENKSNINPDPLYSATHYSHPTVLERIQRISKYD